MKRLLFNTLVITLVFTLFSCGNGRRDNNRNSRDRNGSRFDTEQSDYSDNVPQNSKKTFAVEPTSQQIKTDLAGKSVVEPTHKAYRSEFKIRSANNVLDIEIQSTEKTGNQIVYQTRLTLSDDINIYLADVDITYSKVDGKWVIQYLQSKYLDILPTGHFANCIIVKKESGGMFSEHLFWYNNCDVALLVEGRIFAWTRDGMKREWQDFADIVPASGKADFYYETNVDYEITRIERP